MLRFLIRRLILILPVLLGLLVLTFLLVRIVPSDPAAALAGEGATPEQIDAIRHQYGLDRPLIEQFFAYALQVAQGDLGVSYYSNRPIALDIAERLPATLELSFVSLLFSVMVGVPFGIYSAIHHNGIIDHLMRALSVAGIAIASFWLAIILQLIFSMDLEWLPLRGRLSTATPAPPDLTGLYLLDSLLTGQWATFWDALKHIILPSVTLALGATATIVRFARSGVLDTLQRDYVAYERAVGYPRRILIWKYVLRNSVITTVTQIGLLFGSLLAGAVVIEAIFDWPGLGSFLISSLLASDYQAIVSITLVVGLVYALLNILVDVVHALLDPRIKEQL